MKRPLIHITESLGGVETYLSLLFGHVNLDDRKVVLIVPKETGLTEQVRECGGEVIIIPMINSISLRKDVYAFKEIRKIIKRHNNPIIHLHSSKAGALGRLASIGLENVAVIHTPHAYYYLSKQGITRLLFLYLEKVLKPLTDIVATTSPSESERCIKDIGFSEEKVNTLTNSIDVDSIRIDIQNQTRKNNNVLMVGRISYQKNVEMFLDVVSRLQSYSDIKFQLIGVGYYKDDLNKLNKMLKERQIKENRIEIINWIDRNELFSYMQNAKVCVLTSRYESFGYVIAEAALFGVPAVATNVDGIKDVVKNNVTGFLVEVGDIDGMSEAILKLINDEELYRDMSKSAYERVTSKFDISSSSKNFELLYKELDI